MAIDTIAETLNSEGVKPRSGGKWYGSSVSNVLKRNTTVTEAAGWRGFERFPRRAAPLVVSTDFQVDTTVLRMLTFYSQWGGLTSSVKMSSVMA